MYWAWWNFIWDEEKKELLDVIESKSLSRYSFYGDQPSKVVQFEKVFSEHTKSRYCIGMNSCTSALYTAILWLGIREGDEVIVSGYTFIATAAAVIHARAVPVFSEIDESLSLDPLKIEEKITGRTKAIIVTHMLGCPCDMEKIVKIAKKHDLFLLEDVAQACWGSYRGVKLWKIGDVGVFSLNIFKMITAGDGWVLTTDNKDLYRKFFALHDHGFMPDSVRVIDDESLVGMNFRMHEFTGAMALAQTRKLNHILSELRRKKQIFKNQLRPSFAWKFRDLNDPDGDCSTTIVLLFESAELADKVAQKIWTKSLIHSGKHYYGNMLQIHEKKFPFDQWSPFYCDKNSSISCFKWMLPQTDDILARAVAIGIWVEDRYLGTNFWISAKSTDSEIKLKAIELQKMLDSLFD